MVSAADRISCQPGRARRAAATTSRRAFAGSIAPLPRQRRLESSLKDVAPPSMRLVEPDGIAGLQRPMRLADVRRPSCGNAAADGSDSPSTQTPAPRCRTAPTVRTTTRGTPGDRRPGGKGPPRHSCGSSHDTNRPPRGCEAIVRSRTAERQPPMVTTVGLTRMALHRSGCRGRNRPPGGRIGRSG